MSQNLDRMDELNEADIKLLARLATGREDLRLVRWNIEPVTGGFEMGSGLERITGQAITGEECVEWSVIRKIIRAGAGNDAGPQASHFWEREPRYYQSGIITDLPGGLRAPRCYGVSESPGRFEIFLENLTNAFKQSGPSLTWSQESYCDAARCLGRFNGAYLTGKPIPTASWIPRQWMRAYVEEAAPNMGVFLQEQDHPVLQKAFGRGIGMIKEAWDRREEMLDALYRLPQVFCHNDAFTGNLFGEYVDSTWDGARLAAVDWSYAGPGPLGSDLAPLITLRQALEILPLSAREQFDQVVLEAYLQGLKDAGWEGSPDLVRFSFSAASVWRYLIGAFIGETLPMYIDEGYRPAVEQLFGKPFEQFLATTLDSAAWFIKQYETAWRLKRELHL